MHCFFVIHTAYCSCLIHWPYSTELKRKQSEELCIMETKGGKVQQTTLWKHISWPLYEFRNFSFAILQKYSPSVALLRGLWGIWTTLGDVHRAGDTTTEQNFKILVFWTNAIMLFQWMHNFTQNNETMLKYIISKVIAKKLWGGAMVHHDTHYLDTALPTTWRRSIIGLMNCPPFWVMQSLVTPLLPPGVPWEATFLLVRCAKREELFMLLCTAGGSHMIAK